MNAMDRFAAVIPAGGRGVFEIEGRSQSKLIASVSRKKNVPMIIAVINAMLNAGIQKVVVVVNALNSVAIQECVCAHGFVKGTVQFAHQIWRAGAADAVSRAFPYLELSGYKHIVVTFADMPLWEPETIADLARLHLFSRTVMAMATIERVGEYPAAFDSYGRIERNDKGSIANIVEVADATVDQFESTTINPSLYAFDVLWLEQNMHLLRHHLRPDGYDPEYYLPPIVSLAAGQGLPTEEYRVRHNVEQALGINSLDQLEVARNLFDRQEKGS
jgi:bifunctional N-acetylglucosamine-1-phosphate-uridyltransferase/glucosamine-1-phosphate-acetyltransferase GlmU-like protein